MEGYILCPRCEGTGVWAFDNCCGSYEGCVLCGGKEAESRRLSANSAEEVSPDIRGSGLVSLEYLVAWSKEKEAQRKKVVGS